MFIENVPALFINDPAKLEIGMDLWSVGQGGVTGVKKPSYAGKVEAVDCRREYNNRIVLDANFMIVNHGDWREDRSYKDAHISEQSYNNWYLCADLHSAQTIYEFMIAAWNADPAYEAARKAFDDDCRRWDDMFDRYSDDY